MSHSDLKTTEHYQELAKGTNVSEVTLLATDYLNHFNEIVMLLDMVPDMAECLDDAKEWKPKSYQDHFRDSFVADKELAVEAYDFSPPRYKVPFDRTTEEINQMVADGIVDIETALEKNIPDYLREIVGTTTRAIQVRMDRASAIIYGDYEEQGQEGKPAETTAPDTTDVSDEESLKAAQDEIDRIMAEF